MDMKEASAMTEASRLTNEQGGIERASEAGPGGRASTTLKRPPWKERAAFEKRAEEEVRWEKRKEKLEAALRQARK